MSSEEGAGGVQKGIKHYTSYQVGEKSPGTHATNGRSGRLKKRGGG